MMLMSGASVRLKARPGDGSDLLRSGRGGEIADIIEVT
jgi:hypothetical protein